MTRCTVALLLVAGLGCKPSQPQKAAAAGERPVPVRTVEVQRGTVHSCLELSSDSEAESVAVVRSRAAGQIAAIYCREGQMVEEGAALVELDSSREKLAVKKAEANLALARLAVQQAEAALDAAREELRTAELTRKHAEQEYKRAEGLRKGGIAAISEDVVAARKYEYDQAVVSARLKEVNLKSAEAALAVAKAKVADAQIALEEARLNLSYRTVRAPVAGQVVSFDLHVGDYLSQGQIVARIENPEKLFVRFDIAQSDIRKVKAGQKVIITTQAFPGEKFIGIVEAVNRAADPEKGTVRARVSVPKPGHLLPGLFVVGKIVVEERSGVQILPRDCIRYEGRRPFVWYVDGSGRARRAWVQLGIEEEDVVEVLSFGASSTPPGPIIVVGNVKDGTPVVVMKEENKNPVQPEEAHGTNVEQARG